ncbi:MAG: hypothetical protein ABW135_16460 [Thermoleophilaceae bacterium]
MLFDLRGRRRRAVQVTYLFLALLMGGGLVLFGIGGDVSGGLVDAFKSEDSGGDNSQLEERIERNEKRLAASPANEALLATLVRDNFALASARLESGATEFPPEAKADLRKASTYWVRYVDAVDKPSDSLARLALQIYDPAGLDQPKQAQRAMQIVAERQNDFQAYLALVQRAVTAGDTRTADLAGQKAVDLAPKDLRKQVEKQVEQLKKPVPPEQQPSG